MDIWKAPLVVQELMQGVKEEHHHPRLEQANIVVCLEDSRPFPNNSLNWGKTVKLTQFNQLWQPQQKTDFCLVLCADIWHNILDGNQKLALLDLHLTRCQVEYIARVDERGRPIKDEWGRIDYTNEIKLGEDGRPKWKIIPFDLTVFTGNVRRFGLWCPEIENLGQAVFQFAGDENE